MAFRPIERGQEKIYADPAWDCDEPDDIFGTLRQMGIDVEIGGSLARPAPRAEWGVKAKGHFEPIVVKGSEKSKGDNEQRKDRSWLERVGGKVLDASMMARTSPPPIDWVFPSMKAGVVKSLASAGGVGKTWVALGIGMSIASGVDILGLFARWGEPIRTGRVVYFCFEDDEDTIWHRIRAMSAGLGENFAESLRDFRVISIPGGINIASVIDEDGTTELCQGARLVFFDTFALTANAGDENKASDMKPVMSAFYRIAAKTRAAVVFLHHFSKLASLNGDGDQQQALRGSSVIVDNTRGNLFLQTMTEEEAKTLRVAEEDRTLFVRFGCGKENLSAGWPDMWLLKGPGGIPKVSSVMAISPAAKPTVGVAKEAVGTYKGREIRI